MANATKTPVRKVIPVQVDVTELKTWDATAKAAGESRAAWLRRLAAAEVARQGKRAARKAA